MGRWRGTWLLSKFREQRGGRFFQCMDDYTAQVSNDWKNLPARLPTLGSRDRYLAQPVMIVDGVPRTRFGYRGSLIEFFEDNHIELYDLKDDPGEKHDLSREEPELAQDMKATLPQRQDIEAKIPQPNADWGKEQWPNNQDGCTVPTGARGRTPAVP